MKFHEVHVNLFLMVNWLLVGPVTKLVVEM